MRPVGEERVGDFRADPSFVSGQCETKPLLLTPSLVDGTTRTQGMTPLIVNRRSRYLAKVRVLSVKDMADTRVLWV